MLRTPSSFCNASQLNVAANKTFETKIIKLSVIPRSQITSSQQVWCVLCTSNNHGKKGGNRDSEGKLWKDSKTKEQLVADLISGHVPLDKKDMKPDAVYNLADRCDLFHQFPFKQFRDNLNRLRKTHRDLFSYAESDYEALMRDRTLHPKKKVDNQGKPVWDESEAQLFLRQDRKDKLHETMSKTAFYASRLAYQLFDKKTFLKHIEQERRREIYIAYRNLPK